MVMIEFHWWYIVVALMFLAAFLVYKLGSGDMFDGIMYFPLLLATIAAMLFYIAGHYLLSDTGEMKCPTTQVTSKP